MQKQIDFLNRDQYLYDSAIALIKEFEPVALERNPLGYIVGYSGGKDSDVLVWLFMGAGVKFAIIHNHTTLDAPQTVYHIRERFNYWQSLGIPCFVHKPENGLNFFRLCEKQMIFPLQQIRFCCAELKEKKLPQYDYACFSFGVRKAESVRRKKNRDSIEMYDKKDYSDKQQFHFDDSTEVRNTSACYTKNYFYVNPMAYFPESLVWDIIQTEGIKTNPLYAMGLKRVGCIGCPYAREHRKEQFEMFPAYKKLYLRCACNIIKIRDEKGLLRLKNMTGEDYFNLWMTKPEKANKVLEGQTSIFD